MKKLLIVLLLLCTNVFGQAISRGEGHIWEKALFGTIPGIQHVSLSGINGAGTTAFEPLWRESAAYTVPTAALTTPYCASSSANDTAAGTGARTLRVKGTTTAFNKFTEDISMNGQTSVTLTTASILLFTSLEVLTTGSGGVNAGIIQCGTGANTAGDPAATHAYLQISSETVTTNDGNKSEQFFYAVPSGYTLICKDFVLGSLGSTAANTMYFAIDSYTNLGIVKRTHIGMTSQSGGQLNVSKYVVFPEKTIIIGKVAGVATTTGPFFMSANCLEISNTWAASAQGVF